jgi:hypothetical protein
MGKLLSSQISVATGAFECSMWRSAQGSRVEGGRRSRLALACAGAGFVATHARLASRQGFGLLGLHGRSKEDSGEASGGDSNQKALLPFELHAICPSPHAIIGEFHSTSFFQQCREAPKHALTL